MLFQLLSGEIVYSHSMVVLIIYCCSSAVTLLLFSSRKVWGQTNSVQLLEYLRQSRDLEPVTRKVLNGGPSTNTPESVGWVIRCIS